MLRDLGEFCLRRIEVSLCSVDIDSHVVSDLRWDPITLGWVAEETETVE
jgi:hypothetical protein